MASYVQCTHCGRRYDIGRVTVIARYAECTVFTAPCCGRTVDDRRGKSLPDVRPVTPVRDVWNGGMMSDPIPRYAPGHEPAGYAAAKNRRTSSR